jgi:hypothetical protein
METQRQSDCPDLDALELFLASDPEQLNSILDQPFGAIIEYLDNLGFDGERIFQSIRLDQCFSREVWVDSVGIDSLEQFLSLSPIEYCDKFPLVGAPLVAAVVDSIHVGDDQSQLRANAGGTNLTKSQKWEIGIAGGMVGVGLIWGITRLGVHQVTKNTFRELLSDDQIKELVEGMPVIQENAEVKMEIKKGLFGDSLDIKFRKWSDRAIFELKSTSPYLIWKWLTAKKAAKESSEANEIVKAAEEKADDEVVEVVEDTDVGYDFTKDYRRLRERPQFEIKNLENSFAEHGGRSLYASLAENHNSMLRSLRSREGSFIVDDIEQQLSNMKGNMNEFERFEYTILEREVEAELGSLKQGSKKAVTTAAVELEDSILHDLESEITQSVLSEEGEIENELIARE